MEEKSSLQESSQVFPKRLQRNIKDTTLRSFSDFPPSIQPFYDWFSKKLCAHMATESKENSETLRGNQISVSPRARNTMRMCLFSTRVLMVTLKEIKFSDSTGPWFSAIINVVIGKMLGENMKTIWG